MSQAAEPADRRDDPQDAPLRDLPRRSALRRYFLLEEEIEFAKKESFGPSHPGYREYERAKGGLEAISAITAAREDFRFGDGSRPALSLAREATLSAIRAHAKGGVERGAEALWEELSALPVSANIERSVGEEGWGRAEQLLVGGCDISDDDTLIADLALLRDILSRLLAPLDEGTRRAEGPRAKRALRIGSAALLAIALLTALAVVLPAKLRGPNLALNRPTIASSHYGDASSASGVVDGVRSVYGFHTDEEDRPWVRIDLGSAQSVGKVVVYNRRDCCEDRAAPLLVEGSLDGELWQRLATRRSAFTKWTARFDATEARFVRLTAEKKTFLHLNEVEIYER